MDTFEREDVSRVFSNQLFQTFKFSSLLRVKIRDQRKGGKPIEPVQIYDKVKQL